MADESVPGKDKNKNFSRKDHQLVLPKSVADKQRLQIEKLMRNPEKPVFIPERPKEWKTRDPPEFVRDVMGSSAGAGSGEFHVYRGYRRREYARQMYINQKAEKEEQMGEFQKKIEENEAKANEKTSKKRNKRMKKKQKMLLKKKRKVQEQEEGKKDELRTENKEQNSEHEDEEEEEEEGSHFVIGGR